MITKEQAMVYTRFKEVRSTSINPPLNTHTTKRKWRAIGKCKTWKTRPLEFKLPIKYGLYNYAYITHDNCQLFELDN